MPDINQELQIHHTAVSYQGSIGNQAARDTNPSAAKKALEEVSDINSYVSAALNLPNIKKLQYLLKKKKTTTSHPWLSKAGFHIWPTVNLTWDTTITPTSFSSGKGRWHIKVTTDDEQYKSGLYHPHCSSSFCHYTGSSQELAKQLDQRKSSSSPQLAPWNPTQDSQSVHFWEQQTEWELSRLLMKNRGCTRLNFSQSYPKIPMSFSFLFEIVVLLQVANMVNCVTAIYTEAQKNPADNKQMRIFFVLLQCELELHIKKS